MGAAAGPNVVEDGLVLALDAGNTKSYPGSGTTWTDISGKGHDGTIDGSTYNSGDGGYLIFDGTDDKVTMSAGSDFAYGTGDFTFEFWFNVTGTSPQQYGEKLYCQSVSGHNYIIINASEGSVVEKKPSFKHGASGGGTNRSTEFTYTENNWHHYVISRNGTTLTQYIDGDLKNTHTGINQNFDNTTYNPTIGAFTHANSNNFDGKIAQVRVYKGKGLTAAEVKQNYNAIKGRYVSYPTSIVTSGLILHLDAANTNSYSGSGNTWTDLSGNSNNATLTGPTYNSDNGGALIFDGFNDYATISNASALGGFSGDFTIEFWFKGGNQTGFAVFLESWTSSTSSGQRWAIQAESSGTTNMIWVRDGSVKFTTSGIDALDNAWHHHAVVRNGSTINYYIDGVSRGSENHSASLSSGTDLIIGEYSNGSYHIDGRMSAIRIYNEKGLTAAEVLQNYNALKGRYV